MKYQLDQIIRVGAFEIATISGSVCASGVRSKGAWAAGSKQPFIVLIRHQGRILSLDLDGRMIPPENLHESYRKAYSTFLQSPPA